MNIATSIAAPPGFRTVGVNAVKLFGLPAAERARRFAAKAGIEADAGGASVVLANLAFACDPAWFGHVGKTPGAVLTLGGRPVLAHARNAAAAAAIADAMGGAPLRLPAGHDEIAAERAGGLHFAQLRKREAPYVMPLTPATADAAERASYDGAYKGVTDALTLYLWRRPAFHLTRWAAKAGLSPNFITAVGAALCVLAFFLFWEGRYWEGVAAGFAFMVLDTVDGKLARCTGTSSKWGNVFDHGIDLVHPPFWWWAWGQGLVAYGTPLTSVAFKVSMGVILIGYVLQRLIEGVFIRRFGMHIHVWERIDSRFRLVTARRNPNMVILVAALLAGRPDIGLVAVAAWVLLSLLFHFVRYLQAIAASRTATLTSWLG